MTSVVVEKIAEDMAKHLEAYRDLVANRAALEERLQRANREKSTVKEAIFKRVCDEYATQIKRLEKDIEPLHSEVARIRMDIDESRADVESQIQEVKETIEELAFRHRVGEFDAEEFSDREEPLRDRIEGLQSQDNEFKKLLKQIDEAEQRPDTVADDTAPDNLNEPEGTHSAAKEPPAKQQDDAEEKATPSSRKKAKSKAPMTTPDVIDTSEWASEFGMDRRKNRRRTSDENDGDDRLADTSETVTPKAPAKAAKAPSAADPKAARAGDRDAVLADTAKSTDSDAAMANTAKSTDNAAAMANTAKSTDNAAPMADVAKSTDNAAPMADVAKSTDSDWPTSPSLPTATPHWPTPPSLPTATWRS
jgi:hypothetical protein